MWEFEHTITTEAKKETIWALYSNFSKWTDWDKGIIFASLEGPFVQGSKGLLQPEGQEPLPFELTNVEPLRGFSDVTDIPDAGIQIHFTHLLVELAEGTKVTHKVTISGPNAEQLGPQIGAGFAEGIPTTMESLVSLALEKEREHAAE
ncbi:SRPBCC family protein [Tumebacillus permanentifrigoris]|nr:SRPBCC family protein [Tumebacillus permanentifrigoris]